MKCNNCKKIIWIWQKFEYATIDLGQINSWFHKDCLDKVIRIIRNKKKLNMGERLFLEMEDIDMTEEQRKNYYEPQGIKKGGQLWN